MVSTVLSALSSCIKYIAPFREFPKVFTASHNYSDHVTSILNFKFKLLWEYRYNVNAY